MSARRAGVPVRGYALTPWSRALVDVTEGRHQSGSTQSGVDSRKITTSRRYFRDRHVHRLAIRPGRITSSVEGSQLDPFDVIIDIRTVDTPTVVTLLRAADEVTAVMPLTRGEQPATLGELLLPTESADIAGTCSCPDDSGRCIHILSTIYEVAAEIDRTPTTLLTVMGTSLPELLEEIENLTAPTHPTVSDSNTDTDIGDSQPTGTASTTSAPPPRVDFYGTGASAPRLPSPHRMSPMTELDAGALRAALRASGVAPGDIAEAVDDLADLYDRLIED